MTPIVYITLTYILGIIIANFISSSIWFSLLVMILIFCTNVYLLLNKKDNRFFILAFVFILGVLNLQIRQLPPPQNDISNFLKKGIVAVVGQVDDEPRVFDQQISFPLLVEKVNDNKASGKLSVSVSKTKLNYGDKVAVKGYLQQVDGLANPGLFSYADYLQGQGISCQLRSSRAPPKIISNGGGNFIKKFSIALKNRFIIVPLKTLPEPYSTLLASIVFGSRAAKAPKEIKETYKKAGVAHLLVASGMHLGILVGVCLFIVRSTRMSLSTGILITSLVNWLYALMTGFGPSILRAAIMAEIMLAGMLFEREKEAYTCLSIAAFIILLFSPKTLFNVGFQLSFAATWSFVYIAPVFVGRLKQYLPHFGANLLAAAVAPVLVTIPITLFHFSQASIIGVVTNLFLLPWISVVVILGFVASVFGVVLLPLGELLNSANLVLLWIMHVVVSGLASLPFAQVFLSPPGLPMIIGYYFGLVGLTEVLRSGKWPKFNKFRIAVLVLAVFSLLIWNFAFVGFNRDLTITVLDVGQGDSILIEAPSGKKILVDGGEFKMGDRVVLPFLRLKGISCLDLVILTHAHSDHLGGILELMPKIKFKQVLDSGLPYESKSYQRFLGLVKKNKIKYNLARAGAKINFAQNLTATILHPSLPFLSETNSDCNNSSIVFRLKYGKFSMMFTGDNEEEGEQRILEHFNPAGLKSTILKVGHHGSRTSTSPHFLEAVNPQVAIISCGRKNKFRHPHKVTLDKLKAKNIKLYRTDRDGAVVVRTDGRSYRIRCMK